MSRRNYAAFRFAWISLRLIRHSAICTALSAAPLRRLSETHPQHQAVLDRRVLADAADVGRVLARRLVRRDVAAGLALVDDDAARRIAQDLARLVGGDRFSNSMFTASEWPMNTGTRTQVAVSLILGSRIFLVSTTIFHSSLV